MDWLTSSASGQTSTAPTYHGRRCLDNSRPSSTTGEAKVVTHRTIISSSLVSLSQHHKHLKFRRNNHGPRWKFPYNTHQEDGLVILDGRFVYHNGTFNSFVGQFELTNDKLVFLVHALESPRHATLFGIYARTTAFAAAQSDSIIYSTTNTTMVVNSFARSLSFFGATATTKGTEQTAINDVVI